MSEYIVSARKYRPKRFDEVVGQGHVTDTLKKALSSDQVAHAFLFCGPRGVGKTTCARILAKTLNCMDRQADNEPCNQCDACKAFNDAASFSILELDAASNNSVDNIRNLVEQVKIPPPEGQRKIFIVDEVHMLSPSAFNAFLKTLEEPPSYAVFIFATTEKHKILPTILSRCQIYDFKRIQVDDIITHLKSVADDKGAQVDDEALYTIAQRADGALRDALSLYDRLHNQHDGKITYQAVSDSLGMVGVDLYFEMMDHILAEHAGGLLMMVNRLAAEGYEYEIIFEGLASHVRQLLYHKYPDMEPLLSLPERLLQRYRSQAAISSESLLINGLDMISDTLYKSKLLTDTTTLYEVTLAKLAYLSRLVDADSSSDIQKKKSLTT